MSDGFLGEGQEPKNDSTEVSLAHEVQNTSRSDVDAALPKKQKKWLAALFLLLLAIFGIGGGLLIWSPWDNNGNKNETTANDESVGGEEGNTEHGSSLVTLDVNDELVKKVLGRVMVGKAPHAGMGRTYFWTDLLWNGGSDDVILKIAFLNTTEGECKVKNRPNLIEDEWELKVEQDVCINGETIRQNMRKIFGREVAIEDGKQISYGYFYDKSADEFYKVIVGGGGGPAPEVIREIYKVEKDDNRLYIYEYAATVCMIKVGDTWSGEYGCPQIIDPQNEPHMMQWFNIAKNRQESVWLGLPEAVIPEMSSGPYVEVDENGEFIGDGWREKITAVKLSDYAQFIDSFKWTFRLDGAGNYVFESLEEV